MRYWWVNQNQTYRWEFRGNFVWSLKANANGARNQPYENVRHVAPGDVVFSLCDTQGRRDARGRVTRARGTTCSPGTGRPCLGGRVCTERHEFRAA